MRRAARLTAAAPHARGFLPGLFGGGKDKKDAPAGGGFKLPGMNSTTPDLMKMWQMIQNQPVSASHVTMMRQGLSMRKTVDKFTRPAFDDDSMKYLEKMVLLLEKKAKGEHTQAEFDAFSEELRKFQAKNGGAQDTFIPPPPPTAPPKVPQQQQEQQQQQSFSNPNSPTIDELRRINLGPEIEALFTELRTMREKRNAVRSKLAEREAELDRVTAECKHAKDTESSLRQRLQLAEQNVLLLNSDLMDLKEKAAELKTAKATVAKLQQAVHSLQSSDTAPLAKKIESLEALLADKDDQLRSSARKIDRLRRRDPLLQFSGHVNVLTRNVEGHSDVAADSGAVLLEDSFNSIQESFSAEVASAWAAAAARNGNAARHVVAAAKEFFRRNLDHAALDASVGVTGNVEAATAIFTSAGFSVAQVSGRLQVTSPLESGVPVSRCGPFALAAALSILTAPKQQQQQQQQQLDFTVTAAHPMVSETLAKCTKRTRLEFDTCRSSKPGGQAANVAETQITVRLFVDDVFAFSSEAQDTRSAVSNKELALERLTNERLPQFNTELSRGTFTRKFLDRAQSAFASDDACSSLLSLQAYIDEAQQVVSQADAALVRSLIAARSLITKA
jgi:hypothetical protein